MKLKLCLIILAALLLVFLVVIQLNKYNDGQLHLVFCDVGQGDAIYIKTPSGSDILVDGGPDDKVISCLENHMPFWDRELELVILSHPHADHLEGLIPVLEHFQVDHFATENIKNATAGYSELISILKEKKIQVQYLYKGDKFTVGRLTMSILGPTEELLKETSPNGVVGEKSEFGNVISLLQYGYFRALLVGDSQAPNLLDAISGLNLKNLDVMQVPHHGSATGLSKDILDRLQPKLGVISVGKNNRYHHPAFATLVLLEQHKIPVKRTDQDGEVEIVSDGATWKTASN